MGLVLRHPLVASAMTLFVRGLATGYALAELPLADQAWLGWLIPRRAPRHRSREVLDAQPSDVMPVSDPARSGTAPAHP